MDGKAEDEMKDLR